MIIALVLFAFTIGFLLGVLALWLIAATEYTPILRRAQKTITGVLPAIRLRETEALPKLPTGKLPRGEITRMYHAGFPVKDLYKEDTWLL